MITSGQVLPSLRSPTKVIVTLPQLSLAVTKLISAAGTSPEHSTVTGPGQVIVGGVISPIVIVWVQVLVLPQSSSA